jgi:intraflagellar transport protein 74
LNDLDPEQRNEYDRLKRENQTLQTDINGQRQELEDVNSRLAQAEARLRADTLKQRSQHLRDEKTQLSKRKEDLELQTNEMNLPFPEARERLMNRIKQDNAEIKMQEKEVADARKIVETYNKSIKDIENDLAGNATQEKTEDAQKFEILYQKEQEISDFTMKFESEKTQYEQQIADS